MNFRTIFFVFVFLVNYLLATAQCLVLDTKIDKLIRKHIAEFSTSHFVGWSRDSNINFIISDTTHLLLACEVNNRVLLSESSPPGVYVLGRGGLFFNRTFLIKHDINLNSIEFLNVESSLWESLPNDFDGSLMEVLQFCKKYKPKDEKYKANTLSNYLQIFMRREE